MKTSSIATPTSSIHKSPVTPRKKITDLQGDDKDSTFFPKPTPTSSSMVASNSKIISNPLFNEDVEDSLAACNQVFKHLSTLNKENVYTIFCLPCNNILDKRSEPLLDKRSEPFLEKALGKVMSAIIEPTLNNNDDDDDDYGTYIANGPKDKNKDNHNIISMIKGVSFLSTKVEVKNTLLGNVLAEYSLGDNMLCKSKNLKIQSNGYSAVIDGLKIPASPNEMHNNLLSGVHVFLEYIDISLYNKDTTIDNQTINIKIYGVVNGAYVAASIYSYIQNLFKNTGIPPDYTKFCNNNNIKVPDIKKIKEKLANVTINYYLYLSNPARGGINPIYDISHGLPAPYGKNDDVFIILTNALYGEKYSTLNKLHDITNHIKVSDPKRIKLICISECGFIDDTERNDLEINSLSRELTYRFFNMKSLNNDKDKKDIPRDKAFKGNATPKREEIHKSYTEAEEYKNKIQDAIISNTQES